MSSENYLSQMVREARGGQSLRVFAKECGISHSYLRKIEFGVSSRGKSLQVTLHTLAKLKRAGVKIDFEQLMASVLSEK